MFQISCFESSFRRHSQVTRVTTVWPGNEFRIDAQTYKIVFHVPNICLLQLLVRMKQRTNVNNYVN